MIKVADPKKASLLNFVSKKVVNKSGPTYSQLSSILSGDAMVPIIE